MKHGSLKNAYLIFLFEKLQEFRYLMIERWDVIFHWHKSLMSNDVQLMYTRKRERTGDDEREREWRLVRDVDPPWWGIFGKREEKVPLQRV